MRLIEILAAAALLAWLVPRPAPEPQRALPVAATGPWRSEPVAVASYLLDVRFDPATHQLRGTERTSRR